MFVGCHANFSVRVARGTCGWDGDDTSTALPETWCGYPIDYIDEDDTGDGSDATIPELDVSASAEEVAVALEGSTDTALVENITDVEMYSKYREWALSVNDSTGASVAGAEAVKASPNAWLSFALGSSTLIADEPVDGEVTIDSIGTISSDGTMAFTVSIEDIAVGNGALEENPKKVFNIEGTTSIGDSSSFSSDNVEIHLAEPVDGKVKFTVSPKGSPNTFFIRSKLIK